jgi:hypothetical protein
MTFHSFVDGIVWVRYFLRNQSISSSRFTAFLPKPVPESSLKEFHSPNPLRSILQLPDKLEVCFPNPHVFGRETVVSTKESTVSSGESVDSVEESSDSREETDDSSRKSSVSTGESFVSAKESFHSRAETVVWRGEFSDSEGASVLAKTEADDS